MADIEREFISVILLEGDLTQALDAKITPEWFNDPDHARVWTLIQEHYRKYSEVPSASMVRQTYPNWKPIRVEQKVDWYVDAMVDSNLQYQLTLAIAEAQDALKPAVVRSAEDADYLYLLMPVRVS